MKIQVSNISSFLLLFLYCVLIYIGSAYFAYMIPLVIVFLVIFFPAQGAVLAILTYLMSPDVSINSYIQFGLNSATPSFINNTIFLSHIGNMTVATLLSIVLLILGFVRCSMRRQAYSVYFLVFILFPLVFPLYGFLYSNASVAFTDSGLLFGGLLGFWLVSMSGLELKEFCILLVKACLVVAIVNILISIFLYHFGMIFFGVVGNIFPIAFFYMALSTLSFRWGGYLIFLWDLLLQPARSRILIYIYGFILVALVTTRDRWKKVGFLVILLSLFLLIFSFASPEMRGFFEWKLTSLNFFSSQNVSSHVRLIEFLNIFHQDMVSVWHFLFGFGYGSWYSDAFIHFPSEVLTAAATSFSSSEYVTGHFIHTHLLLSGMLLYSGVLLTLMFYFGLFWGVFVKLGYLRFYNFSEYLFLLFIPLWAVMMFNQKSYLFFGMMLFYFNQFLLKKGGKSVRLF